MSVHFSKLHTNMQEAILNTIRVNVATICHGMGVYGTFTIDIPETKDFSHHKESKLETK